MFERLLLWVMVISVSTGMLFFIHLAFYGIGYAFFSPVANFLLTAEFLKLYYIGVNACLALRTYIHAIEIGMV